MTRALIAGWFSFPGMGATAGDVLAAEVAAGWLRRAGRCVDVAAVPPFVGDVELDAAAPGDYDELVFVCGPFGNGPPIDELLRRFSRCHLVGLDLSLLQPLDEWDPFDLLVERDSDRARHPDLALAAPARRVPVVAVVEVHPQQEYGDRGRHAEIGGAIGAGLAALDAAVIHVDTALERNAGGLRSAAQVQTVLARSDVVVTTRLHGMVLALQAGVPAVAIDPIAGGEKVTRQAEELGWPHRLRADEATPEAIRAAVVECLEPAAKDAVTACAAAARCRLGSVERDVIERLREMGASP